MAAPKTTVLAAVAATEVAVVAESSATEGPAVKSTKIHPSEGT